MGLLPALLRKALHVVTGQQHTKLALVVRGDLKMSKGKTAAQCAHASVLCYQHASAARSSENQAKHMELLAAWLLEGQPKIVLRLDGYDELLKLQQRAQDSGIIAKLVRDAGRTQLQAGTATVLGLGPDTVDKIDYLVAHLKLL